MANGVYLIGAAHDGRSNVFTAAWVTQVSFDPLLLALSINRTHATYSLITASRAFSVNVLGRDQLHLARHFGCQSGREADKLATVHHRFGPLGTPMIIDTLAWIECRVVNEVAVGDHQLLLGAAQSGDLLTLGIGPLRYRDTGNLDGSASLFPSEWPDGG